MWPKLGSGKRKVVKRSAIPPNGSLCYSNVLHHPLFTLLQLQLWVLRLQRKYKRTIRIRESQSSSTIRKEIREVSFVFSTYLLGRVVHAFRSWGDPEFCGSCSGLQNTARSAALLGSAGLLCKPKHLTPGPSGFTIHKCRCCRGYVHGTCGVEDSPGSTEMNHAFRR